MQALDSPSLYLRHLNGIHPNVKNLKCPRCNSSKIYSVQHLCKHHLKTCNPDSQIAPQPVFEFQSEDDEAALQPDFALQPEDDEPALQADEKSSSFSKINNNTDFNINDISSNSN